MIRKLYCDDCGSRWKVHPQDCAEGWQHHIVHLSAKKPASHVVEVFTGDILSGDASRVKSQGARELPSLVCDLCGNEIADGQLALAVSMTKGDFYDWEHEYGTVLTDEAYKAAKRLAQP